MFYLIMDNLRHIIWGKYVTFKTAGFPAFVLWTHNQCTHFCNNQKYKPVSHFQRKVSDLSCVYVGRGGERKEGRLWLHLMYVGCQSWENVDRSSVSSAFYPVSSPLLLLTEQPAQELFSYQHSPSNIFPRFSYLALSSFSFLGPFPLHFQPLSSPALPSSEFSTSSDSQFQNHN